MGEYRTIKRRVWQGLLGSCRWCGRRQIMFGKRVPLFTYGPNKLAFCNKSCAESYHGKKFQHPVEIVQP